jgi:hypothetical protein
MPTRCTREFSLHFSFGEYTPSSKQLNILSANSFFVGVSKRRPEFIEGGVVLAIFHPQFEIHPKLQQLIGKFFRVKYLLYNDAWQVNFEEDTHFDFRILTDWVREVPKPPSDRVC